jgi:hypothetical protein
MLLPNRTRFVLVDVPKPTLMPRISWNCKIAGDADKLETTNVNQLTASAS